MEESPANVGTESPPPLSTSSASSSSPYSSSSSFNEFDEDDVIRESKTTKKKKRPSNFNFARRSKRGKSSIFLLADAITSNKNVLFITGAGLSVSSGIRPFRGVNGLWGEAVWSCATRDAFRRNPLEWYNTFWLKHFPPNYHTYKPSPGHEALAELTTLSRTNIKIITQNVDGLHSNTKCEWDSQSRLIEAHGRVGLYKCIPGEDSDTDDNSDDESDRPVMLGSRRKSSAVLSSLRRASDAASTASSPSSDASLSGDLTQSRISSSSTASTTTCPYEILESIPTDKLEPADVRLALMEDDDGKTKESSSYNPKLLSTPPLCPSCSRPCPPQALLFDEGYHSHHHYQFKKMEQWITEADVLVFVGTSFAVSITDVALDYARERRMPVYNFNLERLDSTVRLNVENILGDADETLTMLLSACQDIFGSRRREVWL